MLQSWKTKSTSKNPHAGAVLNNTLHILSTFLRRSSKLITHINEVSLTTALWGGGWIIIPII